MTTDSSVRVNLNDLFEMEAERRVAEATAKERARAEEADRQRREAADRERAIAEARDGERERAEQQRAVRDGELEDRIGRLRSELDEVRRDRERMLARLADRVEAPAPASNRGGWIAGIMAAASLIAATGAIAVSWPRADIPPMPVVAAPVTSAPSVVAPDAPILEEEEAPSLAPVAEPAPVEVASRTTRPRPPRSNRPATHRDPNDLSHQLDLGDGDEVLDDAFLRSAGN
ncbi:MAG: hypothetical protein AB7S26_00615 [Sandaracinaceae bacterium]